MATRRTFSLLAILALLSPLAATAVPGCPPGAMAEHCPMMAAMGDEAPPCHEEAAIEADDCCPDPAAVQPAEGVPVVAAGVAEAGTLAALPPARPAPARRLGCAAGIAPAPLYRLHRALLI